MATTHAKFPYLAPPNMTDDNMEISSEFGGGDNEDIDIDLDIPNEHHDEDHTIEDAKLETGFDGGFEVPYETRQEGGNDDLMIDGENSSFPMNDFEAADVEIKDLDPDESDDSEMVPLTQVDESLNKFDVVDSADYIDTAETSEPNWDTNHFINSLDRNEDEEEVIPEIVVSNESTQNKEQQQTITRPPKPSSNPTSPSAIADASRSAGTSEPASTETADGTYSAVTALTNAQIDSEDALLDSSEDRFPESRAVIVIYQDTEYALIATSEDENPNSFFLKDDSLTYAPLSAFFTALREVLSDDITLEDELCISVSDLSLEFTETCQGVDSITFKQVIDLRSRLFMNDGVQAVGPAFVTLTAKPEFSKKFAALSAGAAEGKGLSELVSWDEISRDLDDDKESHPDDDNRAWATKDEDGNESENRTTDDSPALPEEEVLSEKDGVNEEGNQGIDFQYGQEGAGNFEAVPPHPSVSANAEAAPENNEVALGVDDTSGHKDRSASNQSLEDLDEDGDLIDYEEEEFEQGQRQVNGSNSHKVTQHAASESPEATDTNREDANQPHLLADEQVATQDQASSSLRANGEDENPDPRFEYIDRPIADADQGHLDEIEYDTQAKSDVLPVDEIGYDEAPEGGESNESDHTLVEDNQIEALDEAGDELDFDEINYEDDDHPPEASEDHRRIEEPTHVQPVKRPRDDTEEVLDTDGKGSKRARS